MKFLIKKYTLFIFIFMSILLFGCNSKREKGIETTVENRDEKEIAANETITKDNSQFLEVAESFNSPEASEATQNQLEKSYQKSQKTVNTKVLKQSIYIKKISTLTKLDLDKMVEIKYGKGLKEIEKIIATLPENESKREAQRLTMLMRFSRIALSEEAKEYLLSKKDDALSEKEQIETYLTVFVEASYLNSNSGEEIKSSTKKLIKAKQVAELTQLDFEKLAIIESQLGLLGLRSAITNIPNFPQKEKALKIISE